MSNNNSYLNMNHPSKEIIGSESQRLNAKRIALCVTGSIAAYRAIDLSRLLMRHGAEVLPIMTKSATDSFLSQEMMKWATGNNVITKLTSDLEHIRLADYKKSDLILVYPCTGNTIGKFANGIDDSVVTTVLSVGFGAGIPILIAPAMHQSMYENKIINRNIATLKSLGISIVEPTMVENKAKVADPKEVLEFVLDLLYNSITRLKKKILVTAGSTLERIDPVRVLTNLSSGKMGIYIAEVACRLNHDVTAVCGHIEVNLPNTRNLKVIRVESAKEMYNILRSEILENKPHIVFHCAAVSDYTFPKPFLGKLDGMKQHLTLKMVPTKKIVNDIKKWNKSINLVAFKAEYNISPELLIERAFKKLKECDADFVVANDLSTKDCGFGSENNEVYIIDKNKKVIYLPVQKKSDMAARLIELVIENK